MKQSQLINFKFNKANLINLLINELSVKQKCDLKGYNLQWLNTNKKERISTNFATNVGGTQ